MRTALTTLGSAPAALVAVKRGGDSALIRGVYSPDQRRIPFRIVCSGCTLQTQTGEHAASSAAPITAFAISDHAVAYTLTLATADLELEIVCADLGLEID